MTERGIPFKPRARPAGHGWGWLLLNTASHMYLVFLLALAVIATIPLVFGWQGSVVQSASMEPLISPGDVVLSTELPAEAPVPIGGVVEFERAVPGGDGTMTVLHRIVEEEAPGSYTTAGDANADVDSTPIQRGDITGQGRVLVPFVGLPGLWASTTNLPALAVWAILTLAAIAVSVLSAPARSRRDVEQTADPEHFGRSNTQARRTVLTVMVGSAAAGLVALPRPQATAAFTGMTSSVDNTWSVRTAVEFSLDRATPYALLAGRSVVNSPPNSGSFIDGSVGTSPGGAIEGFRDWQISGGSDRDNDVARSAMADAVALYAVIDSRDQVTELGASLPVTVRPGVYRRASGELTVAGVVTLDGGGNPDAIFIFAASSIVVERSSHLKLVNGAAASNVFWRSTGSISIARDCVLSGNFLATGDVGLGRSVDLTGRVFSSEGAIALERTTLRLPGR